MRVVVFKMLLKFFCLVFILNWQWSAAWDVDEMEDYNAGKAPFFELPCMRIGGTCAKINSCPPGTKVGQKGLCPEQQRFGMECCRPRGILEMRAELKENAEDWRTQAEWIDLQVAEMDQTRKAEDRVLQRNLRQVQNMLMGNRDHENKDKTFMCL